MSTLYLIFWFSTGIICYTYLGYPIILFLLVRIKRLISRPKPQCSYGTLPEVTLLVAAYNEKAYIKDKVLNTISLDYPSKKIKQLWVTDGSDDGTPEKLERFSCVKVLHQPERQGKIAAINRAMRYVDTPVVIFSDANTLLGHKSVKKIVELFADPKVGCVSGEKRIVNHDRDKAAGAGEGLYWRYESTLKKWDAELNSTIGAAGELFAIRTKLFREVENDTILDDFIISLRAAMAGNKIGYDPEAFAIEKASANMKEELKRKTRIAAGGIQSVTRLMPLLNIFKYGLLSFQYISHRVLRWTIAPLLLPFVFLSNIILAWNSPLLLFSLIVQVTFYLMAMAGWLLKNHPIKIKGLFAPYYFFIMNYAVFMGLWKYARGRQSAVWERSQRA